MKVFAMAAYSASLEGLVVFALSNASTVHSGNEKELRQVRQGCERYAMLPVKLGGHVLSVPAMSYAGVRMNGHNMSTEVASEQGAFCVPHTLGTPPFTASRVSLHGNETSRNGMVIPGSRLFAALGKFGLVYIFWLTEHRAHWDTLPGGSILPQPDASQPKGTMTVGWPASNAYPVVLARTSLPDENGFRYAAHCWRALEMTTSVCTITIADGKTGLDYYRPLVGIPDEVYSWRENEPVPDAFIEIALSGRELLASLAADPHAL